jgi:uncharacterized repeat protein (TIGR03803 family)
MMKNLPIYLLLLMATGAQAQPQLVTTFSLGGTKEGGALHRMNLPGTSPGVIHTFDNFTPHRPTGGVVYGNANWLYGFLQYNGTNRDGALYKIRDDGSLFTKLYDASSPFYLSSIPYYHTDGLVYFSTGSEVKKYDPSTNLITDIGLHNFGASRTMTIDADGWMYFVGSSQNPAIFRTKTDGSAAEDLITLTGATHGWNGNAGLTEIPGDSIFGVMANGGINDEGTIYSIKKDGTGLAVHHHFSMATGRYPESKLVYFDGKLYGTTFQGGDFTNGVLYTINADGTGYRVLHHFALDGPANMQGNIAISNTGRIFGTYGQFSQTGGGQWRAWKVDTSGENFQNFISADQRESGHGNRDILLADDETIILTTAEMGRYDGGALSLYDTSGTGSSMYHFGLSPNGFRPNPVIKSSNGKLYGTTTIGGATGNGIIYTMNADGTGFQKLHEFTDAQGYEPIGKLLEASDGKLYGTTRWGGPVNGGLLFRIDKTGANFQVVYSFPLSNESYSPIGGLVEDNAGFLYGTTIYGVLGTGTVYRVSKTGTGFTVVKTFGSDLQFPRDGLELDNGWLYGTCGSGGAGGNGGVYRLQTDGTGYQVLHDFIGTSLGAFPIAIPIVASNGKLYGTTNQGGTSGEGTLWSMDLNGANFTSLKSFSGSTDGSYPIGSLIQGTDGLLYGINASGGPAFGGTVYRTNLDGSNFTVVKSFDYQLEGQQISGLLDLNGNFVLPVELISFNAEKKTSGVLLSWKTAQEQNSDRFEIERSGSGNNFTTIGRVKSAGNTTSITNYSFTDPNPINGINYYRLKQVDMDEKFTHSKTIPVDCSTTGSVVITPNPVMDKLQLRLPLNSHFTSLRILDVTGKPVFQKAVLSSTSQQFDISHLAKGWYVLHLLGDKEVKQVFVKQ